MSDLLERLREMAEACKFAWGFGPSKSEIAELLDDACSRITYLQTENQLLLAKLGLFLPSYQGGEKEVRPPDQHLSLTATVPWEETIKQIDGNVIQFVPRGKCVARSS